MQLICRYSGGDFENGVWCNWNIFWPGKERKKCTYFYPGRTVDVGRVGGGIIVSGYGGGWTRLLVVTIGFPAGHPVSGKTTPWVRHVRSSLAQKKKKNGEQKTLSVLFEKNVFVNDTHDRLNANTYLSRKITAKNTKIDCSNDKYGLTEISQKNKLIQRLLLCGRKVWTDYHKNR